MTRIPMDAPTAKALVWLLKNDATLWAALCCQAGVPDPLALPKALTEAHRRAVRRTRKT